MGYWDKMGCRLNMKIHPDIEQTTAIIIHAIPYTLDNHMDNHGHLHFICYLQIL